MKGELTKEGGRRAVNTLSIVEKEEKGKEIRKEMERR